MAGLTFRVGGNGHEDADASHPLALLRLRCERPRRRAAEQRDELAAFDLRAGSLSNGSLQLSVPRLGNLQQRVNERRDRLGGRSSNDDAAFHRKIARPSVHVRRADIRLIQVS
jgi:hypothetical protein